MEQIHRRDASTATAVRDNRARPGVEPSVTREADGKPRDRSRDQGHVIDNLYRNTPEAEDGLRHEISRD